MHWRITIDCDLRPLTTAAYLRIAGKECAFIETNTSHSVPRLMSALAGAGREPQDVRWVVITHAHLDHAAGASGLMKACPNATLLAHPRAARHMSDPAKLIKGATAVYGEERFAKLYGVIEPIAASRVRALEDGATFDLGDAVLQVLHTAGHANHHFVIHDPRLDCVYTGDSFGLVYPSLQKHGRFAIASTSPSNFDAAEARKSLERIMALKASSVCPTHFDAWSEVDEVGRQTRAWVDHADEWLEQAVSSGDGLDVLIARLGDQWLDAVKNESKARSLNFGPLELEFLAMDLELNAQGLAVVAMARRAALTA